MHGILSICSTFIGPLTEQGLLTKVLVNPWSVGELGFIAGIHFVPDNSTNVFTEAPTACSSRCDATDAYKYEDHYACAIMREGLDKARVSVWQAINKSRCS